MGYSVGQLPYQTPKGERKHSMVEKAGRWTITENLARRDLLPMVKAKLLELQSPVEANQLCGKVIDTHTRWSRTVGACQANSPRNRIEFEGNPPKRAQLQRMQIKVTNGEPKGSDKTTVTYPRIAYVPRGIRQRNSHSSLRTGKPFTWRRGVGVSESEKARIPKW